MVSQRWSSVRMKMMSGPPRAAEAVVIGRMKEMLGTKQSVRQRSVLALIVRSLRQGDWLAEASLAPPLRGRCAGYR